VHTLLLAAGEPSKVPFYFAGGVLAVYAVALAGVGLTRPEFPYGKRGARGIMALSFVLVVIAIAMALAGDP
jgi:hypothetical protein